MGISGLLPLLKEITVQSHIKEWKGKTLAVDAYVWLHRGAYGCAEELATGKPTVKYVNYAMHRVRMLKYYGVTPYIVFDGGLLPSKMGTEVDREKRRNEALAKGNSFKAEGKHSLARESYVKAVDVTPEMAYQLIKALRQEDIQYVVAPYEADPQLAYLEKEGIVDGIITEDSDLLVFGCRNVLFKLDGEGHCHAISRSDFSRCREYNFSDWSDREFRQMAILSGCDYLDSISGMGLKTAYRLMRKYKTAEKVIQFVRLDGQMTVPRTYPDEFRRAELTFLHQRVFDPVQRRLVHFSPVPDSIKDADLELPFVGASLDQEYVCRLADGEIDPISKLPIKDLVPDAFSATTAHRTTHKATPLGPVPSKAKPSPSLQPAKGAASLLNFFSRTSNAAAGGSKASPVNTVKTAAISAQSGRRGGGKENGTAGRVKAVVAPSPKRKSKFFGGGSGKQDAAVETMGKKSTVDGTERQTTRIASAETDEVDDDEVMIFEPVEGAEDSDRDAELALQDVEMDVSPAESSTHSEPQGGAFEPESPASPARPPSPTPCISSPVATPPPRGLPHEVILSPIDRRHGTKPEDDDAVAVSSPASSAQAEAGWDDDRNDARDATLSGSPLRSVPALPRSVPVPARQFEEEVKPEPAASKQNAVVSVAKTMAKNKATDFIELSSDPIDVLSSSDGAFNCTRLPEKVTPRPPPRRNSFGGDKASSSSSSQDKKPTLAKKGTVSTTSKSVRVRPDPLPIGKGKKRGTADEEEDVGEVDTAVQNVASSWRAKFMLQNSSASRTPRPKTTVAKPSVVVPTASDVSTVTPRAKAEPRKPSIERAASSGRTPLSPRSTNNRTPQTLIGTKPLPPPGRTLGATTNLIQTSTVDERVASSPKKRRKVSTCPSVSPIDATATKTTVTSTTQVSSFELHKGSSSPIVITNPKLLAFRFKGSSSPPT